MSNEQPERHVWTPAEIDYLVESYHNTSTHTIAYQLGLTPRQVSSYAGKLLLRKTGRESRKTDNKKKIAHDRNILFLIRDHYTVSQIASSLQISEAKVERWINNDLIKTTRKLNSSPNSNNPHRIVKNKSLALFMLRCPHEIAYENMPYDSAYWVLEVINSVVKTVPLEKNN